MKVTRYVVGPLDNNLYIIEPEPASDTVVVVDPGFGSERIADRLRGEGRRVELVVNTHAHLDHVAANAYFVHLFGCPVALHRGDLALVQSLEEQARWFGVAPPAVVEPQVWLDEQKEIRVGTSELHVIHTPGHSPGHVCLATDTWMIVGDLVFAGSIGRTDLPGGDYGVLMRSIREQVLTRDDSVVLYPGHGPETTVGRERATNPFLQPGASLWV